MFQKPLSIGTKIVKVGARRRVLTIVEKYAAGADIVYLALGGTTDLREIGHKALMRGLERGDYVVKGGEAA
jgi:hypothetical protein